MAALPEVSRTVTLNSFIPADQTRKIAALKEASQRLGGALDPPGQKPAPNDQNNVAAIRSAAENLDRAAANAGGAQADAAHRVSALLRQLAGAGTATRTRADAAFVPSLDYDLDLLRRSLAAEAVTTRSLPQNLKRDWLLPDGKARVQALPKGDPNDTNVLRNFATAVLRAEPAATGGAISLYELARTVTTAFVEAGILALTAVAILLLVALRRLTDVLLTLVPLLLAGVVTLQICVLDGIALNFANIIALPLLLGVGVAFKIYYIMAWRAGRTGLLQSSLTRAVVFSAHDHRRCIRQHVGIELSGDVEHGQADGAGAGVHDGGRGAVPAGLDGPPAAGGCGQAATVTGSASGRGIGPGEQPSRKV